MKRWALLLALAGCARALEAPPSSDGVVRFMRDPIRIDGQGAIARRDFHRFAVRAVADAWLPVLALERAVCEQARRLGLAEPEPSRVRELRALVEASTALRARFPAFPKNSAREGQDPQSSATCALRLALCLAWLEVVTAVPSNDPVLQVARLEDALRSYGAGPSNLGATCAGLEVDAREVWPELLARSDLTWREAQVRRALDAE